MQPNPSSNSHTRPDILRKKHAYGIFYGVTVGLSFAIATWGMDGYILSQAHACYPWLKLIIGSLFCALAGGTTGWLVARIDRSLIAVLLWLITAGLFSWLIVVLPLQIAPRLTGWFQPEYAKLVNYSDFGINVALQTRIGVAYVWVGIFITIVGFLQLTLSESAMFASTLFGRFSPVIISIVIVAISGSIVDGLNNEPLRAAIQGVNDLIQFAEEHQGQTVDPATARQVHLASLREAQDLVSQPRYLAIGKYDEWLGRVEVLVKFGNEWVNCSAIYNQPSFCKKITTR